MDEVIQNLKKESFGKVIINPEMSKFTTYRVGGPARVMVYPKSINRLVKLIAYLKEKQVPYKIMGNGSNLIFPSKGYDGVIVKLDKIDHLIIDGKGVRVGAGYSLMKLAYKTCKRGLSGLEFATGIPGSVGGSVYMNAGAYKSDMGYVVTKALVLTPTGDLVEMNNKQLDFHYRTSYLQTHPGHVCVEATIQLKPGNVEEIMDLVNRRRDARLSTQPLEYPSAGSVFRNPQDQFAGKLVEDCGLKGYHIHDAYVSEKHANFIVNKGNATGDDVIKLIRHVKETVKNEFHIDLRVEQEIVE